MSKYPDKGAGKWQERRGLAIQQANKIGQKDCMLLVTGQVLTSNRPACRLIAHAKMGCPIPAVKHGVEVCAVGPEAKVMVGFEDHAIWQG